MGALSPPIASRSDNFGKERENDCSLAGFRLVDHQRQLVICSPRFVFGENRSLIAFLCLPDGALVLMDIVNQSPILLQSPPRKV